ncbi:MAG TPA: NAD(P)/FAD-dependent oxidoreductase [Longimicrobiales bacterium]
MPASAVIIVGGGAAGLSAAGAMARRGIDSVVLEQDAELGGSWARRYDRLHLHTMRGFSGLAHYAIPRRYPRYLSRDDVVAYLNEYARRLDLRIAAGTTVVRVRPNEGGWVVETAGGEPWRCAVVVVATGQYRVPVLPAWPGREAYRGRLLHSASYANALTFRGERVLVVGAGNSGAEIATDLAENGAACVALSVRTPPTIVPRDPLGMPSQRTSILLSALPPRIADWVGAANVRLTIGDLARSGMPTRRFTAFSTRRIPLIDVGFVDALRQGRVKVKPALERLSPEGALFADGSGEPYDTIVAATGFTTGLASLIEAPGVLDEQGEPRGTAGEATAFPGLYFIGFTHSLRGHLFEANRASRRLARNAERYLPASFGPP